ncbi:MAG: hypothetical protein IKU16_07050 [Muribaculaceae bacterium]|nr:hypothetical protein [Muribaculaceae bacterium]
MNDKILHIEDLVDFINSHEKFPHEEVEEICNENGWWWKESNRISSGYDEHDIVIDEDGKARLELIEGGFDGPVETTLFDTREEAEEYARNIPNCKELSEGDFLNEIFTHEDDENPDSPNYTSAIIAMNERGTILGIIGYLN